MFICTTDSLWNFHSTRITHIKMQWVEHTFEKLGHLCHPYFFLICLITSRVTQATGITKSERKQRRHSLYILWSSQRNVSFLSIFQRAVCCTELLQGCNKFLHKRKIKCQFLQSAEHHSRMFLSCLWSMTPREFWSDGRDLEQRTEQCGQTHR